MVKLTGLINELKNVEVLADFVHVVNASLSCIYVPLLRKIKRSLSVNNMIRYIKNAVVNSFPYITCNWYAKNIFCLILLPAIWKLIFITSCFCILYNPLLGSINFLHNKRLASLISIFIKFIRFLVMICFTIIYYLVKINPYILDFNFWVFYYIFIASAARRRATPM